MPIRIILKNLQADKCEILNKCWDILFYPSLVVIKKILAHVTYLHAD